MDPAIEEVLRASEVDPEECFFWAVHAQAELDLLFWKKGKKVGFEFKFSDAPRLTHSMQAAFEQLGLEELFVVYPGSKDYYLTENIKVMGLENYLNKPL